MLSTEQIEQRAKYKEIVLEIEEQIEGEYAYSVAVYDARAFDTTYMNTGILPRCIGCCVFDRHTGRYVRTIAGDPKHIEARVCDTVLGTQMYQYA